MAERASDGVRYAPHRRHEAGRLRRLGQRAVERLTVLAYRATSRILGTLPLGLTWPVFRLAFLAAYYLWPPKRRVIQANAAHVLSGTAVSSGVADSSGTAASSAVADADSGVADADSGVAESSAAADLGASDRRAVDALARRVYQTYARYVVELMRLPSRPAHELAGSVVTDPERGVASFGAIFDRLQAEGRGMIAVSCHIGNIEALAAAFAAHGWPAYGLADDTAFPELYALLQAQRKRWGIEVLGWRNMRGVIRVLKGRAILGLLVDWGYRAEDVPVRLFGAWTTLPAGPAVLAARTKAAILPVVCRRRPDGRFEAEHLGLIDVPDDSPASIQRATQALADAVQAMVVPAPEQWYIFKPMWPADEAASTALAERAAAMLAGERA